VRGTSARCGRDINLIDGTLRVIMDGGAARSTYRRGARGRQRYTPEGRRGANVKAVTDGNELRGRRRRERAHVAWHSEMKAERERERED